MCKDHLRSDSGHFWDHLRRQNHLRSWDHLRCRTGLFFFAKVALVRCNMQMGKCDHQILLERKMIFYVRGTSFRIFLIDFLTLILHNLPRSVLEKKLTGGLGFFGSKIFDILIFLGF